MSDPVRPVGAAIVGGGLTGTVLAMYLARRGMSVEVFERELRDAKPSLDTSSINLTLCRRGLAALDQIGVGAEVRARAVAVEGRVIHLEDGTLQYRPYGPDGEALLAVTRQDLLSVLRDAAAACEGVRLRPGHRCQALDPETGQLTFVGPDGRTTRATASVVLGADGAFSHVRGCVRAAAGGWSTVERTPLAYKQLDILPSGGWTEQRRALHVWPRGGEMMLAIPNRDGSFTAAVLLPLAGRVSHATLTRTSRVVDHFHARYPDAADRIDDLGRQFLGRRRVPLATVRCRPWSFGRTLLVGDAAHAVLPSYGQGANAGFEDSIVLDRCLDLGDGDWTAAVQRFEALRRPALDAMADLSEQHLVDLRSSMADPSFLTRGQVEAHLAELFPGRYRPLYETIAFTTMPYDDALARDLRWRPVVDELCADAGPVRAEAQLAAGRIRAVVAGHGILEEAS